MNLLKFSSWQNYCKIVFAILILETGTPCHAEGDEVTVAYALPINDGALSDMAVVVELPEFKNCDPAECTTVCGVKNKTLGYCDDINPKLCMCAAEFFYTSELEGTVAAVDRSNENHKNCSVACNKRNSYARIWTKPDNSQHCTCLMHQVTSTGITLCDENAIVDICKSVCQTETAQCSFNGVCLCRKNWDTFFQINVPFVRKPIAEVDKNQCAERCSSYHHDFVPRIFDTKMNDKSPNREYKFREKFCLCGEWNDLGKFPETQAIIKQGFQLCTGLKCKRRCGMDEAICEPKLRRGCLCQRESILIGQHLWSRLPSHSETKCYETCSANGYDARVIEWNPFMDPRDQFFQPHYRQSAFQYLYDGKFCHCIKAQIDMHQYRPCTDELCRVICGHHEAECDKRTRRACFCNTHKPAHALGRRPDPGEVNCDISCRYGLFDARILDLKWEIPTDSWGVTVSKYCMCTRTETAAGLTHCDPINDECTKYCGTPDAYCTREKYCYCGIIPEAELMKNNPSIRLGSGKEQDECGETCRSWMWPLTEDRDSSPYIYDESLATCGETDTCPKIDTSPWKPDAPGAYSVPADALSKSGDKYAGHRRFCLCAKTEGTLYKPGSRFIMHAEPTRVSNKIPCFLNHTCAFVGTGLHIIA